MRFFNCFETCKRFSGSRELPRAERGNPRIIWQRGWGVKGSTGANEVQGGTEITSAKHAGVLFGGRPARILNAILRGDGA